MQKTIDIDGLVTPVTIAKRKGAKSIRIAIKNDGRVRLTIPHGVPEFMAKKFLISRLDWIKEHQQLDALLKDQAHIGKNHRLHIIVSDASRSHSKITNTAIIVHLPSKNSVISPESQSILRKACEKALLQEAEMLFPQRLKTLSEKHNIAYSSITVKKLKSRWGACDNSNNLSFNSYLVQLDWKLIDYVMLHELAHTIHHHHQESFWNFVAGICPNHKELRRELKTKQTAIAPTNY